MAAGGDAAREERQTVLTCAPAPSSVSASTLISAPALMPMHTISARERLREESGVDVGVGVAHYEFGARVLTVTVS